MAGSSCQPGSWRLSYAHPAGSNVAHNSLTRPAPAGLSFQGQIRDVRKSLVFGTGRGLYGNHIFSVYPVRPRSPGSENQPESPSNHAYTENSSFRYTLARALPPRLIRNFPTPAQGGSALLHLSRRPLRNVAEKHDGDWT